MIQGHADDSLAPRRNSSCIIHSWRVGQERLVALAIIQLQCLIVEMETGRDADIDLDF